MKQLNSGSESVESDDDKTKAFVDRIMAIIDRLPPPEKLSDWERGERSGLLWAVDILTAEEQ